MQGGGYPSNYPQYGGAYGGGGPYAANAASAMAGFPPNSGPPAAPGGYGGGYGGYGGYQQPQAYGGTNLAAFVLAVAWLCQL